MKFVIPANIHYYDLQRYWTKRIMPHLEDQQLNEILVRDFNRFTWGRWRKKFVLGDLPEQFESCDWRLGHSGPTPRFWAYTKHSACHWLVNFALRLATLVEPEKPWRILTSDWHSTVWDGEDTLFDFNFMALGVPAWECFALAAERGRSLEPARECNVDFTPHYSIESALAQLDVCESIASDPTSPVEEIAAARELLSKYLRIVETLDPSGLTEVDLCGIGELAKAVRTKPDARTLVAAPEFWLTPATRLKAIPVEASAAPIEDEPEIEERHVDDDVEELVIQ